MTYDYKNIEYHIDYLLIEISFYLEEAYWILRDELYFSLFNVSTINLKELKDD